MRYRVQIRYEGPFDAILLTHLLLFPVT